MFNVELYKSHYIHVPDKTCPDRNASKPRS